MSKTGEYQLRMMTIDGNLISEKKIRVEGGKHIEQLPCSAPVSHGIYLIQVVNLATKKLFNNKILVL